MLLGWGSAGLAYHIGRRYTSAPVMLPESGFDQLIAFNPHAIWLYLSFFILMPYAYLKVSPTRLLPLQHAMQWAALISGLVFVCYPSTLLYPTIEGHSASITALHALIWVDSHKNCLPSLHASLTMICVWALWQPRQNWRNALYALWAMAIGFSIIQLRRHLLIDVSAGLLVGIAAILWAKKRTFNPHFSVSKR